MTLNTTGDDAADGDVSDTSPAGRSQPVQVAVRPTGGHSESLTILQQ
jgi:hypothetical protein